MTNAATTPAPRATDREPGRWFVSASWWLLAAGVTLGVLKGARMIDEGWAFAGRAGLSIIAEAGYALVLHSAAGLLVATPVRALGAWLDHRGIDPIARGAGDAAAATPETRENEPEPALKKGDGLVEARRLLLDGDWEGADRVVREMGTGDGDARTAAVLEEIGRAREDASRRWRSHVQAAREANDPNRVLELYEEAPKLLDEEARRDLDQDLAKWFLNLVHRRLRSGVLQVDVVTLVDRASGALGHTKEGASLRAALPTLRRGAGLCARCAKPYRGFAEACPECLGAPEPPPPFIPGLSPVDEIEAPTEGEREADWFLDPDEDPNANGRYHR